MEVLAIVLVVALMLVWGFWMLVELVSENGKTTRAFSKAKCASAFMRHL